MGRSRFGRALARLSRCGRPRFGNIRVAKGPLSEDRFDKDLFVVVELDRARLGIFRFGKAPPNETLLGGGRLVVRLFKVTPKEEREEAPRLGKRLVDGEGPFTRDFRRFGTIFICCPFGRVLYLIFFGRPSLGLE